MDQLFSNYLETLNPASIAQYTLNMTCAFVLGMFVMLLYRLTYSGAAYSRRFMMSLGLLTIITAMIMNVIGESVALSLGLVGALSIIRFRTAVKDVRDTTFIFWCVGIGICCGVSMYLQATISSVVVAIFLLIFSRTSKDGTYLLVVRSDYASQSQAESAVASYFDKKALLKVRNSSTRQGDLIFEVSAQTVQTAADKHSLSVADALFKIPGVMSVDLVQQTDDIAR